MKPNLINAFLEDSIFNLEKNDFDHIREGLFFLGKTILEISEAIKLCPNMVNEISEVEKMGKLLKFPEAIVYEPHKQLIVNGVDIFPFIFVFNRFYKKQSFTAGQNLGIGAEFVLRGREVYKNEDVVKQYEFLAGFMSVESSNYDIDNQDMYNHLSDVVGFSILEQINKAFSNPDDLARVWVGLNDLAHIFLEGLDQFVPHEIISESSRE